MKQANLVKIRFTKHFQTRQVERDDWMFNVETKKESWERQKDLEWKLLHQGHWYENIQRSGEPSFYCILNQLQVYCAVKKGDVLVVTTTFPYNKSFKIKTLKYPKVDFSED